MQFFLIFIFSIHKTHFENPNIGRKCDGFDICGFLEKNDLTADKMMSKIRF